MKWLYSTFHMTIDDVVSNDDDFYDPFQNAARYGHLEVLQWLQSTFNLTKEDVESNNCTIFQNISEHYSRGYISKKARSEVLEWLYSTFNVQDKKN